MALEQGKAHFGAMPKTGWTVRLIMACQGESLQNCAHTLGPMRPDFFLMPYRLRNGMNCYQLFVGRYPSQSAAEAERKKIVDAFQGKFRVDTEVKQVSEIRVVQ
jgi:septal ring-binding cell division protein DamX